MLYAHSFFWPQPVDSIRQRSIVVLKMKAKDTLKKKGDVMTGWWKVWSTDFVAAFAVFTGYTAVASTIPS